MLGTIFSAIMLSKEKNEKSKKEKGKKKKERKKAQIASRFRAISLNFPAERGRIN